MSHHSVQRQDSHGMILFDPVTEDSQAESL